MALGMFLPGQRTTNNELRFFRMFLKISNITARGRSENLGAISFAYNMFKIWKGPWFCQAWVITRTFPQICLIFWYCRNNNKELNAISKRFWSNFDASRPGISCGEIFLSTFELNQSAVWVKLSNLAESLTLFGN